MTEKSGRVKIFVPTYLLKTKTDDMNLKLLIKSMSKTNSKQQTNYLIRNRCVCFTTEKERNRLKHEIHRTIDQTSAQAEGVVSSAGETVFFLIGPRETLTFAGLRTRSPKRKPRVSSSVIIPTLTASDSSREIASCNCNNREYCQVTQSNKH